MDTSENITCLAEVIMLVKLANLFVCDEGNANKKLLLEVDCLPRLLKRVSSENRTIRRDATLVLGSLSKHREY